MSSLYLLFKTDYIKTDIVAAHESLGVLEQYLMNNHDLVEPEKIGQGWEINLLTYDLTGKSDLKLIKKHTKELEKCNPDSIHEGDYYNIAYQVSKGCSRQNIPIRILKAKCIIACPPNFIFAKKEASYLHLHLRYNDIIVIAKCRENEEDDDGDRFIYYSNLYQWKLEQDVNLRAKSIK